MEMSAEDAKSAVKKYYHNLLELLPISKLAEHLFSRKLLSFDRKSELDKLSSPKEKTRYFLDEILVPGLNIDFTEHFDEMLIMMKESDDVLVRLLAKKLTDVSPIALTSASTNTSSSVVATDQDTAIDSDDIEMKIDFSAYKDVSNAFDVLFAICHKAAKASNENFTAIRNSCVARASEPLRSLLKDATKTDHLFAILAENNKYCNWMNVRFLEIIANACGNKQLQSLLEDYKVVIYSKPMGEVWSCMPHYSVRDKYYSKLKATFGDKDPDNVTIEELMKSKPQLAKEIALLIAVVQEH